MAQEAAENHKSYWQKLKDIVPVTMTKDELIVYLVIATIILIVLCVFCFILKQIIIFTIVIIIFLAVLFWYLYIYRNKDD
mmetsp:Transcript_9646/g.16198  ORF Transcript_9646/g.16198 Transcript_9646/m.16198 type:complete len:80 (-) Transcript_9646:53-292(-)